MAHFTCLSMCQTQDSNCIKPSATCSYSQALKRREALEHAHRQRRDLIAKEIPAQAHTGWEWRSGCLTCAHGAIWCHASEACSWHKTWHLYLHTSNAHVYHDKDSNNMNVCTSTSLYKIKCTSTPHHAYMFVGMWKDPACSRAYACAYARASMCTMRYLYISDLSHICVHI